ncbi:hypothetical protein N9L18_01005 [Candidatus Pacebacteria bacterium]|nr:hypothetical protein [Candidatus Paceibacterota bacterium]
MEVIIQEKNVFVEKVFKKEKSVALSATEINILIVSQTLGSERT